MRSPLPALGRKPAPREGQAQPSEPLSAPQSDSDPPDALSDRLAAIAQARSELDRQELEAWREAQNQPHTSIASLARRSGLSRRGVAQRLAALERRTSVP